MPWNRPQNYKRHQDLCDLIAPPPPNHHPSPDALRWNPDPLPDIPFGTAAHVLDELGVGHGHEAVEGVPHFDVRRCDVTHHFVNLQRQRPGAKGVVEMMRTNTLCERWEEIGGCLIRDL